MLLNSISLNFVIWFPANFFYNEVVKLWKPVFKRLHLPYLTIEDMFNALILSISFPGISTTNVTLSLQNYQLTKRGGKQLDQTMNKDLSLTIKLSEGYMTYMIARQQFELYEKYGPGLKELYFPPINVTILDDGGFENVTYTYYQLTPSSLSDFSLLYTQQVGNNNTFQWGFSYNYFEIYYRDTDGIRKRFELNKNYGMVMPNGDPKPMRGREQYAISKNNSLNAPVNHNSILK